MTEILWRRTLQAARRLGHSSAAAEKSVWTQPTENPTKAWSVWRARACEPVPAGRQRVLALGPARPVGWHGCSYRAVV